MKVTRRILICGGGIAGPACAYWLHKYGYEVVIVERATGVRDGGQNVDIKGAAQKVIAMMGMADSIQAKNTKECGVKFLDASGNVVAAYPKGSFGGLTADFEILRGDFASILHSETCEKFDYRFGTYVTRLEEKEDRVSVVFDNGDREDFELVICAEGIGSSTRRLVLSSETRFRYLGAYMAFFKIPKRAEDDYWAYSAIPSLGTTVTLRPGDDKETTVLVTFLHEEAEVDSSDALGRRKMLVEALADRGTIANRVCNDLSSVKDFYFGPMSQVQMSTWSRGRFVLLGDAAYCPTPFTGQGTALSLVGAFVLAGEIKRSMNHTRAFEMYEQLLRPYVNETQSQISPRLIRIMHPKTALGSWLASRFLKIFASKPMQFLFKPSASKRRQEIADDFVFPDYSNTQHTDSYS